MTDSPAQMLGHAAAWLYKAQGARSMMAFHALAQAADGLEEAATLMTLPLQARALTLAERCRKAGEAIGYPRIDGLWEKVAALADDEAKSPD